MGEFDDLIPKATDLPDPFADLHQTAVADSAPKIQLNPYEKLRMQGIGPGLSATAGPVGTPEEAAQIYASLVQPAIPIPRIHAKSTLGQIAAAPVNVAAGLVENIESPVGVATLPLFGTPAGRAAFGALGTVLGIKQLATAKTPGEATEGAILAAISPSIARSQLKESEIPNASSIQKTTALHGDVRPLEEPASELPKQESVAGVQPQTEAVAQSPQISLEDQSLIAKSQRGEDLTAGEEARLKEIEPKPVAPATMTGAAHVSELQPAGTGVGGEKYGVAERVREERAKAGQVEPVAPGEGVSTQATIDWGRAQLQRDPEVAERAMSQFEADPRRGISSDGMSIVRAKGEQLTAKARTIEEKSGTDSDEYRAAKDELSAWDKRSKAMQTEWHRTGMAQQGETDIDTGSFTGLERARREASDKDFTEAQKPKAQKIADENKGAQQAVDQASERLNTRIRQKKVPPAEQAALDAASKTVREADIRVAQAENKARVADQALKNATEQVQKDAERRAADAASKTVREAAILQADAENKARLVKAAREKKFAEADRVAAAKTKAIADKAVRDAAVKAAREEQKRQADPSIAVWELANKYLDENKGLYGFDDLRNKIAADLKMKPAQVTYWMARDSATKRLADDLWTKQRNARRLKEQAKMWLRELDTPGYQKALALIPRAMFSLSVFGHGFVALGTHAPIVAFQPRFWNAYVRNFGKMYKMVFSPAYYESQMADLVRRPNYERFRRAGLQNDPFQYEEFHTSMVRDLVKDWIGERNMQRVDNFASAGNRGYGVLKLLRQDMADQKYANLPDSIRKQEGVLDALSDDINHATGVTKKQAPKGSNLLLFAPRLEGSRVMWLGGDPIRASKAIVNWKNAPEAERQFAINQVKEKAWVFGTFASLLALNQGFLTASGSKQKINGIPESLGGGGIDPLKGDFMKFKALGGDIAYGGALLTMAKLPARVATAILYEGKGSKYILEDERVDKVIGSYIRSQMAPFAGTVTDLALGRDYEQRPLPAKMFGQAEQTGKVPKRLQAQGVDEPYNWPEFAATKLPIPVAEGIKEGLRGSGMSEAQANAWLKALAVTSLMTATGTRITEDTPTNAKPWVHP